MEVLLKDLEVSMESNRGDRVKPSPPSQPMDIVKMLAELHQERAQLDEAIGVLERVAHGRGKRRGRPPKWMALVKRRGRPPGSKNKAKGNG
jgi:hypothetical protein